ncbi:formylglycine-generating enzyme family protein, partial [Bacteroidota bacterium]
YNIFFDNGIKAFISPDNSFDKCYKYNIKFTNTSNDTIDIANLVPMGQDTERTYITASGPWSLSRSKIWRPGHGPVGCVLPDNAWELGYSDLDLESGTSICALARRQNSSNAARGRWKTSLFPGGEVNYSVYFQMYEGDWQNGLKIMFRDNFLFDLKEFDNKLFEREDLKWIRSKYMMVLQAAWDHKYYDKNDGKYHYKEFLEEGKRLLGGYDVFCIWPTWPRLGLDQRNQWDLYADLPGGLNKMKDLANYGQKEGTAFFISYNPWDQSTRKENIYSGMKRLLEATDADGVVLDTQGASNDTLQITADAVKKGIIMYSEGMAVPKDMPGIVSGRVHDAIFMPPPLNMNKYIKPDFAIFRVCQLNEGRLHRESAVSFFNGIGTEINTFRPGRQSWMEEEYRYLGNTLMILRENTENFNALDWKPLIPTLADSIWVNKWPGENKTIYTVFSLIPEGYDAPLFETKEAEGKHFVSIWNHEEIKPVEINGKKYLPAQVEAFNRSWLNTRREGNIDCIAEFPELIKCEILIDRLSIDAVTGDEFRIWAGKPSYENSYRKFAVEKINLNLRELFGRYEGKFVIQLFADNELIDERVVEVIASTSRLISVLKRTEPAKKPPEGMVAIPGGNIIYNPINNDAFIPYPLYNKNNKIEIREFYMDIFPVTNEEYYKFINDSGYLPGDTSNYLKNWQEGKYQKTMADFPVTWISYKDAKEYAKWAGKRLPTDAEWQHAAQAGDNRIWPWGNEFDASKCNNASMLLSSVKNFPEGKNPYGLMDLVGNVWQMTGDEYDNGAYYFTLIRGGSYYNPTSSWWYVKGGPQQLNKNQMLLLVGPGFDRNATTGFRCVKDK